MVHLLNTLTSLSQQPHVLQCVLCSDENASLLVTHQNVKKVSFTGSSSIGELLSRLGGWKVNTIEGGGKNFAIVMNDCDVKKTLKSVVGGAFGIVGFDLS